MMPLVTWTDSTEEDQGMLKGYTLPLSPEGEANIVPTPPWHYSGDVLAIEFWTDPQAAAACLPPGLKADQCADGHALGLFVDWQFTAQDDEFLDPAKYQYREFYVLVDAVWRDTPVAWCPYIYVDNDAAMGRGWIQGYPKKLASVFQTRSFAAASPAAAPIAAGTTFAGSMSVHGRRAAAGRVTLREQVPELPAALLRPTVNRRYFPRLTAGQHDQPSVNELTMVVNDDFKFTNCWVGEGKIALPKTAGEELDALAPMRVGSGYRFSMSCTIKDLKILDGLGS